jgi:hypothetical protein
MATELMTFLDAEAAHRKSTASPKEIIRSMLRVEEVWTKVKRHITNGGVLGSVMYDHGALVYILLEHDAQNGGVLAKFNLSGPKISKHVNDVVKPLFVFESGRILSNLPAEKAAKPEGAGQS